MAYVTTTTPALYATTSNLDEIPAGADPLQYADDDKMNQILVGLTALHGWASGVRPRTRRRSRRSSSAGMWYAKKNVSCRQISECR